MPSLAGTKWGASPTLGTSGGVVTWSIAGPGLDITGFDVLPGLPVNGTTSVDPASFIAFDFEASLRAAFDAWSAHGDIEFVQVADGGGGAGNGDFADIRIFFGLGDGNGGAYDGLGFFPPPNGGLAGEILFDQTTAYNVNPNYFFNLAIHEIGHAIGLDHVFIQAIMNPSIIVNGVQADDILGIQTIYGPQDFGPNIYTLPAGRADITVLDGAPDLTVNGNTLNNTINGSPGGETVNGLAGSDTINGNGGNDRLSGGADNDAVNGGIGNDTLVATSGDGNDAYDGGANIDTITFENLSQGVTVDLSAGTATGADNGTDTVANVENVIGSPEDDHITGDAGNNSIDGGAGNDTIVGGDGAGNDFYDGGDDIDTLVYTSTTLGISVHLANGFATGTEIDIDTITNIENVITGSGQDAITGNDVANVLSGGDERDTIFGRGGNDTINGDAGNDALFGQAGLDTLNGGTGNDVLFGGDDADILNGGDDNDVLRGEDGDDTLNGDAGDDTILGDQGSDSLNGGDDVDTANYVLSPSAVTVSLLTGTGSGGFAEGDTLSGIERLRGSFHDDFLTGDNEDNLIQGLPGGDTISGGGGNDLVFGGPGDDTINGDAGVDALFGQAGADIINGGDERDVIFGGDEGDTLNGDDGNDVLLGEAGDDTLNGGEGHDSLLGGPGGDDLNGGNGFDLANYVLSSLGVNVSLATGTGSGGDAEGDTLTSIENLRGSNHADTLTGDDGSNQIRGLAGNDIISGNGGVDVLFGNDGEDTLNGGSGTDFLNGGNDDDLYIIEDGTGIDHLIGFEAGQGSDDVADISDFSFADFNAVLTAAFDVGSDVHIQLDADDVLIIQNVLEAELHQDDFLI